MGEISAMIWRNLKEKTSKSSCGGLAKVEFRVIFYDDSDQDRDPSPGSPYHRTVGRAPPWTASFELFLVEL